MAAASGRPPRVLELSLPSAAAVAAANAAAPASAPLDGPAVLGDPSARRGSVASSTGWAAVKRALLPARAPRPLSFLAADSSSTRGTDVGSLPSLDDAAALLERDRGSQPQAGHQGDTNGVGHAPPAGTSVNDTMAAASVGVGAATAAAAAGDDEYEGGAAGEDAWSAASSEALDSPSDDDDDDDDARHRRARDEDAIPWQRICYWPKTFVRTARGDVLRLPSHGRLVPVYPTPEAAAAASAALVAHGGRPLQPVNTAWVIPADVRGGAPAAPGDASPPLPTAALPQGPVGGPGAAAAAATGTLSSKRSGTPSTSPPSSLAPFPSSRFSSTALALLAASGARREADHRRRRRPRGRGTPDGHQTFFTPATMDVLLTAAQVAAIVRLQAAVRRRLTVKRLSHNVERRRLISMEILETEANYVGNLTVLCRYYERPLRNRLAAAAAAGQATSDVGLTEAQLDCLFGEVSNILDCHDAILRALRARLANWTYLKSISNAFEVVSDTLRNCYQLYANGYEDAARFLRSERAANPAFSQFLAEAQAQRGSRYDIADLLIMPIQRLPHYILLLERLRDATHPMHPDKQALDNVVRKVRRVDKRGLRLRPTTPLITDDVVLLAAWTGPAAGARRGGVHERQARRSRQTQLRPRRSGCAAGNG